MTNEQKRNFYHLMLGLPEDVTSPDHYELLGLERFEDNETAIRNSAIDANEKLLAWQNSDYHAECDRVMDAVVKAREVLLHGKQKAKYDRKLGERLGGEEPLDKHDTGLAPRALPPPTRRRSAAPEHDTNLDNRLLLWIGAGVGGVLLLLLAVVGIGSSSSSTDSANIQTNPFDDQRPAPAAVAAQEDDAAKQRADEKDNDKPTVAVAEKPGEDDNSQSTSAGGALSQSAQESGVPMQTEPALLLAPFDEQQAETAQQLWAAQVGAAPQIVNSVGMKLALIPPGEFLMGSEADYPGEVPQHRVRITKPLYLQTTEVTQGQWQLVMGTKPWRGAQWKAYMKDGPQYAANCVSWDDAQEFCRRLSEHAGATYRLPTEAEWEYACRAGTTTSWSFIDPAERFAWLKGSEDYAHQVGQKMANPFGLHDMHGNVGEWCQDWYDREYYTSSPQDDPQGPASGSYRVRRGGSWIHTAWGCQSASRSRYPPSDESKELGFRVVCEVSLAKSVANGDPQPARPTEIDVREGPEYPATCLAWGGAREFCRRLSEKESVTYRLPTEAEWEYACRAGAATVYSFGEEESRLPEYAWYKKNAYSAGERYAHQVGLKKANAFGLHDMHGNVCESCQALPRSYDVRNPLQVDPTGPSGNVGHIARGVGWIFLPQYCRAAARREIRWASPSNSLGFRVAHGPAP